MTRWRPVIGCYFKNTLPCKIKALFFVTARLGCFFLVATCISIFLIETVFQPRNEPFAKWTEFHLFTQNEQWRAKPDVSIRQSWSLSRLCFLPFFVSASVSLFMCYFFCLPSRLSVRLETIHQLIQSGPAAVWRGGSQSRNTPTVSLAVGDALLASSFKLHFRVWLPHSAKQCQRWQISGSKAKIKF